MVDGRNNLAFGEFGPGAKGGDVEGHYTRLVLVSEDIERGQPLLCGLKIAV